MSYGLVRQIGPWEMTANDWRKVSAPVDIDPSDYQQIRPGSVEAINPFLVGISPILDRKVTLPPADDPRVTAPGRRLTINRVLGAKRMPLEGQGAIRALFNQLIQQPNEPLQTTGAAASTTQETSSGKKRKLSPEEMGAEVLNFGANYLPYVLNPGLLPYLPLQVAREFLG